MTDKTQLEAIAKLQVRKYQDIIGTDLAQQIIDLCQPKWIDVNDHPPLPLTKIVLLFETEATRFGEYVPSMKRFEPISSSEKQWTLQPTHWMPLPELPGESE